MHTPVHASWLKAMVEIYFSDYPEEGAHAERFRDFGRHSPASGRLYEDLSNSNSEAVRVEVHFPDKTY